MAGRLTMSKHKRISIHIIAKSTVLRNRHEAGLGKLRHLDLSGRFGGADRVFRLLDTFGLLANQNAALLALSELGNRARAIFTNSTRE